MAERPQLDLESCGRGGGLQHPEIVALSELRAFMREAQGSTYLL